MAFALKKLLAVVLTANCDKLPTETFKHCDRYRLTVDLAGASPVGGNGAAYKQSSVVLLLNIKFIKSIPDILRNIFKKRGNFCALFAAADKLFLCPLAEHRID